MDVRWDRWATPTTTGPVRASLRPSHFQSWTSFSQGLGVARGGGRAIRIVHIDPCALPVGNQGPSLGRGRRVLNCRRQSRHWVFGASSHQASAEHSLTTSGHLEGVVRGVSEDDRHDSRGTAPRTSNLSLPHVTPCAAVSGQWGCRSARTDQKRSGRVLLCLPRWAPRGAAGEGQPGDLLAESYPQLLDLRSRCRAASSSSTGSAGYSFATPVPSETRNPGTTVSVPYSIQWEPRTTVAVIYGS
jgi:hypothetical protein